MENFVTVHGFNLLTTNAQLDNIETDKLRTLIGNSQSVFVKTHTNRELVEFIQAQYTLFTCTAEINRRIPETVFDGSKYVLLANPEISIKDSQDRADAANRVNQTRNHVIRAYRIIDNKLVLVYQTSIIISNNYRDKTAPQVEKNINSHYRVEEGFKLERIK